MASDIPNLKEENMLLLGNGSYSAKHYIIESPFSHEVYSCIQHAGNIQCVWISQMPSLTEFYPFL